MFNNFKKQLMLVALTLFCSYAYGYDLLVISDSKDHAIKFWRGEDDFELSPGFAAHFKDIKSGEKLLYGRDCKSFLFGSTEISRNFGNFSLDKLTDNDFVVLRFDKETGYFVTIIREEEHNGLDWASRFKCEHNKLKGIRYSTSVKKLAGGNGEFDFKLGATRKFFENIRIKLIDVYAGMIKLYYKNYKDIENISLAIDKLNNFNNADKIMGGKIEFYSFYKIKDSVDKLLMKNALDLKKAN